jgi:hypothetical protein
VTVNEGFDMVAKVETDLMWRKAIPEIDADGAGMIMMDSSGE